jgi:beta-lactamase class A
MPYLLVLLVIALLGGCDGRVIDLAPAQTPSATLPARPANPLAQRVQEIGRGFDGDVGIAVMDISTGWATAWQGDKPMPQQSVAKLWASLALLDAVDKGTLRLDEPVVVTREDLSIFHQPIRVEVMKPGGYHTTLARLVEHALTQSDNAANQFIVSRVGGPDAVQAVLDAKHLDGIRFGPGERALQTGIAGLTWRREFSYGKWFWRARAFLPKAEREAALDRYLKDPMDGATPLAVVHALARLQRGELLSPVSTRLILSTMARSETGPKRLRGGLAPGWAMSHKTGTGQVLDARSTGYNDVAVITAPDGKAYAVAVMIASTERPIPERWELMAAVSRAIVDWHDGRDPNASREALPDASANP